MDRTSFRNSKIILLVIMLFSLTQASVFSDQQRFESTIPVTKIQTMLDQFVAEQNVPGLAVGVDIRGERWIGCSGVANLETQEPIIEDTQFRLASVTKTFTAALILKIFEDGKLSLDDTLEEWIPGIVNGDKITIHMLLNHTGGLHDHENTEESYDLMFNAPESNVTEEDVIELINLYPPDFDPGTDYAYCNSGYYLLGIIAEKAGNDTVDRLTQDYLFDPSGMTRTRLTKEGTLQPPYTPGYTRFDGSDDIVNTGDWNLSWDWTAGSGVSTSGDLLTYVRHLFSEKILSQESLEKMTTPVSPSTEYGYGVEIKTGESGLKTLSHTGYNPGTFTGWYFYPQTDLILVFGINYSEYRKDYVYDYQYSGMELVKELTDTIHSASSISQWGSYR